MLSTLVLHVQCKKRKIDIAQYFTNAVKCLQYNTMHATKYSIIERHSKLSLEGSI